MYFWNLGRVKILYIGWHVVYATGWHKNRYAYLSKATSFDMPPPLLMIRMDSESEERLCSAPTDLA